MYFLRWFFPKQKKCKPTKLNLSPRQTEILYNIWREMSRSKRYGHKDVLLFVAIEEYMACYRDIELFLMERGYTTSTYMIYEDGVVEFIITW